MSTKVRVPNDDEYHWVTDIELDYLMVGGAVRYDGEYYVPENRWADYVRCMLDLDPAYDWEPYYDAYYYEDATDE